jgi:hypothetical protein
MFYQHSMGKALARRKPYAERRRVCETSKQEEHAAGFENPRMARIPGFSYTNTLPTYEHGGS